MTTKTTKQKDKKNSQNKLAVLVTTEFKGVFFGYINKEDIDKDTLVLENARNCVYWASSVKGCFGLAANGPNSSCKIGPQVEALVLKKITSISLVSAAAVEKWESAPWN